MTRLTASRMDVLTLVLRSQRRRAESVKAARSSRDTSRGCSRPISGDRRRAAERRLDMPGEPLRAAAGVKEESVHRRRGHSRLMFFSDKRLHTSRSQVARKMTEAHYRTQTVQPGKNARTLGNVRDLRNSRT